MITVHYFKIKDVEIKTVKNIEDISVEKFEDGFIWVDVDEIKAKECPVIGKHFGLHPLTIEDCATPFHVPKVELFKEYLFLVFHGFIYENKNIKEQEVDFVLGDHFLFSFQQGKAKDWWKEAMVWAKKHAEFVCASGPDFLLSHLLNVLIETQDGILDRLNERVEKIERMVLNHNNIGHIPARLLTEKQLTLRLRRFMSPQREILAKFTQGELAFTGDKNILQFRDTADHLYRNTLQLDAVRDLLSGIMELALAENSNKMNEVMKVLTVIATIILPLTLISGIYGMNFSFMPGLEMRYGYHVVLGVMLLVAIVMLAFFRKRKWI